MKKLVVLVLVIALTMACCLAFSACSKEKSTKDILVDNGPYANSTGTVSITFNSDGTYLLKVAGDFYDHTDYDKQQAIYIHYESETINQPFQEVFKYEYKYKYQGKTISWITHSDKAWITIYRLENCNHFWKEKEGGDMYIALDGNTETYGKITMFQLSTPPTTDYLDTLRPNVNGLGGANDSGYIPLADVGCKVEYVQKTHKNVDGNNMTLVDVENINK